MPATLRLRIQTAWLVGVCAHNVDCAVKFAGLSVTTVPLSGRVRLLSRENAVASTVPMEVPAGWPTFTPYPFGT